MNTIPIDELYRLFTVDFLTGKLYWKIQTKNNRQSIGDEAGCIEGKHYHVTYQYIFYKVHRIIYAMYHGEWPDDQIDHWNKDGLYNAISNLRPATNQENCHNRGKYNTNTSGVTGVVWHKQSSKWLARIMIDYKTENLGSFINKWDAICARKRAEHKYGFTND